MKKNKKLLIGIGIVVLLCTILICIYRGYQQQPVKDNVVRVGAILPLTGAVGFEGERIRAAIMMARDSLQIRDKVKLVFADGKWTSKETLNAYNQIRGEDMDAWIVFGDTPVMTLKSILDKGKKPVMCLAGAPDLLKNSKYLFRCLNPSLLPIEKVANYAISCGVSRVAVIYLKEQLGDDVARRFKEVYLTKKGNSVVCEEYFTWDHYDTKDQISKILSANPDAIFVFGYGPGYIATLNNIIKLNYNGLILTDLNLTAVRDKLLRNGEGIVYGDIDFDEECTRGSTRQFISDMKNSYNLTANSYAAFAYESLKMLMMAYQNALSSSNSVVDELSHINGYQSLVGNLSYTHEHELQVPVYVKRIVDGRPVMLTVLDKKVSDE